MNRVFSRQRRKPGPPVFGDINGPRLQRPLWCPAFDGVLHFEQVKIDRRVDHTEYHLLHEQFPRSVPNYRRVTFELVAQVLNKEQFFGLVVALQHPGLRAYIGNKPFQLIVQDVLMPGEWGNAFTLVGECYFVQPDLHPVLRRKYRVQA